MAVYSVAKAWFGRKAGRNEFNRVGCASMKHLPVTGSNELLKLLDPYVPDGFINERWSVRPVRGPRWRLSAAQLWRVHWLALLTPVHSLNLLCTLPVSYTHLTLPTIYSV